ncbi:hypothetical protein ACWCSH_05665, partial [Streptosporangium sp. NPDC001682]
IVHPAERELTRWTRCTTVLDPTTVQQDAGTAGQTARQTVGQTAGETSVAGCGQVVAADGPDAGHRCVSAKGHPRAGEPVTAPEGGPHGGVSIADEREEVRR